MRIAFLVILLSGCSTLLFAPLQAQLLKQDTLRLTISDAEQLFLTRNLQLLAQKYNVDAQRALIIQSKVYPNPNFSYGFGINRPDSAPHESFAGLSQMILLAGKRKHQIHMAETNALLAEDALYDLLRTLKYTLRSDFFSIYYWQQTANVYGEEIDALKKVVAAGDIQFSKGFIAKTELMRDQAQLYSLQSEYNDLNNQINDKESEVRVIVDTSSVYIVPVIDTVQVLNADPFKYPLSALLDSTTNNRPDLMTARHNITLAGQNYKYQKALAVPDITLNGGYDQSGSSWNNFYSLGFGIDIPVFNRNRGNIKSAKYSLISDSVQYEQALKQAQEQVFRALEMSITENNLYKSFDRNFSKEYQFMSKEVLDQYLKRNMGLLDFLSFYDSYKTNIVQLNSILANLANAYEDIDYMTGTDFFFK